jgi:hypothetical protein
MSQRTNSAQNGEIVSDERMRNELRKAIYSALHIERSATRESLANDSGVNIYTIDAILSRDPAKHRPIHAHQMLSLLFAAGPRAVNTVLAVIRYAGTSLDNPTANTPAIDAANMMGEVARFARLAADNLIDHTEEPDATEAADNVIALAIPYSSRRA